MFSSKKNKKSNDSSHKNSRNATLNILGADTIVEGTIQSSGSLRIDGEVKGTIHSDGKLFVADSANIHGDIHCENVEICGKVVGNIFSSGLVTIKESGNIKGDIEYTSIEIEPGAQLACNLNQAKGKLEKVTSTEDQKDSKKSSKTA